MKKHILVVATIVICTASCSVAGHRVKKINERKQKIEKPILIEMQEKKPHEIWDDSCPFAVQSIGDDVGVALVEHMYVDRVMRAYIFQERCSKKLNIYLGNLIVGRREVGTAYDLRGLSDFTVALLNNNDYQRRIYPGYNSLRRCLIIDPIKPEKDLPEWDRRDEFALRTHSTVDYIEMATMSSDLKQLFLVTSRMENLYSTRQKELKNLRVTLESGNELFIKGSFDDHFLLHYKRATKNKPWQMVKKTRYDAHSPGIAISYCGLLNRIAFLQEDKQTVKFQDIDDTGFDKKNILQRYFALNGICKKIASAKKYELGNG